MNLLLHICCAPCTIYPLQTLRNQGIHVKGYFYNPNIHPYLEYEKRKETLKTYAGISQFDLIIDDRYDLELFLNHTRPWGPERCRACYEIRLEATARKAKAEGFEAFSTTLLYSRYQKHDWVREVGTRLGDRLAISFHYQDFRSGWYEGAQKSKELGLYRQPYCGCVFSEKERFMKNVDR